ncbi:hypothetical protein ACX1C1_12680 [Paenibacillus sp. strain BS8-2]
MNPYQNPGAGNGHGSGLGSGQRNLSGSEQGYAHRQGQNVLGRPYSGLHGGFHYDDAPRGLPQLQQQPPFHQPSHQQTHAQQPNSNGSSQSPSRDISPSLMPTVIQPSQSSLLPAAPDSPAKPGFSLANLTKYANLTEIKGFVDRMGGLDGILSTVTKVQKVVGSVSQMAPLVKVFMGSFGKKSESTNSGSAQPSYSRPKTRKRRPSTTKRTSVKRRNRPRRRR